MRKFWKKLLPFALAVACLFVVCVQVPAGESDPDRTGSISVTIRAYATDDVVGGGSLHLYQIAEAVVTVAGEAVYHYTDSFAGCSEDLLTADELAKAETADVFSKWAGNHDIAADETAAVNADGQAYFADLACGLYLITQDEAAEGYHSINAFLVSVPLMEDGAWIYDIDATPKTSPVKEDTAKESGITRTGTQDPDGSGNTGSSGGISAGGGGRTGDINSFLYGLLVIAAALVLIVVLRRRASQREQ